MTPLESQALLAWLGLPSLGDRTLAGLLDYARESRQGLAGLWESGGADLPNGLKLHPRAQQAWEDGSGARWESAGDALSEMTGRGIEILVPGAPECPPLSQDLSAWPALFAYGAVDLLEEPGVAILSSRGPRESALVGTDALADALARRDVVLISSTNTASYQSAATAAKRHAGPSVMVLDRPLTETLRSGPREPVAQARVWDECFDPEVQLLLSPFAPHASWSRGSGPRRDSLTAALASALVAVEVRAGGIIDRLCRKSAKKQLVFALDRGKETPPGTRALWDVPGIERLRWAGSEEAAEVVVAALPPRPDPGVDRRRLRRMREVGAFMARACLALDGSRSAARSVGAYPSGGALHGLAGRWSGPEPETASGLTWLLADLGEDDGPGGVARLLGKVAMGGLLAAAVPAGWLEDPGRDADRRQWLDGASLLTAAYLPPVGPSAAREAVILLRRSGPASEPAPVFRPEKVSPGLFPLRRYLNEVVAALHARREPSAT